MKLLLIITATIIIMGLASQLAYIDRGYIAYGGEYLIWMFPAVCGLVKKEGRENDCESISTKN